jgi:hypothetical protein
MCDTCGRNITSRNEHLIRTDGRLAVAMLLASEDAVSRP